MKKSIENVRERRQKVVDSIGPGLKTRTFDEIVEVTGFSRAEVAFHLARLIKGQKIFSFTFEGSKKEFTLDEDFVHIIKRGRRQEIVDDFNDFMYGCPNPVRVYGVGVVNPNTRDGKRYLDP